MHRSRTQTPSTVFDWASAHSRKGVVTLKGWVDTPWYIIEYQRQAEHVVGVKKVVNDLKFTLGYRHLAWKAVRLIYRENMFPGSLLQLNPPVHVIAENDRVILEGNVGSSALGAYLADLVRYHTDAIRVVNNLGIRS
jgi:osmotically-inducible protein OsmY